MTNDYDDVTITVGLDHSISGNLKKKLFSCIDEVHSRSCFISWYDDVFMYYVCRKYICLNNGHLPFDIATTAGRIPSIFYDGCNLKM